jgi:hypothetical protein
MTAFKTSRPPVRKKKTYGKGSQTFEGQNTELVPKPFRPHDCLSNKYTAIKKKGLSITPPKTPRFETYLERRAREASEIISGGPQSQDEDLEQALKELEEHEKKFEEIRSTFKAKKALNTKPENPPKPTDDQIVDQGRRKNYPCSIDKKKLEQRVFRICDVLCTELLHVQTESLVFFNRVRQFAENHTKDRISQDEVIENDLQPDLGYYGNVGSDVICGTLLDEFHNMFGHLYSLEPYDFWIKLQPVSIVRSILAPEVSLRLIMEDQDVDREQAQRILVDSCDYGRLVFNVDPDVINARDIFDDEPTKASEADEYYDEDDGYHEFY